MHYVHDPQGQSIINHHFYSQVLRCLWYSASYEATKVGVQQGENFPCNTSAQSVQLVWRCLAKHSVLQVRQPPYSPEVSSCDFFC
jgi:hypothetical protein